MSNVVKITLKSVRGSSTKLKSKYYVSDSLAAEIIELIAKNERRFTIGIKPLRDARGRFTKA